VHAPGDQWGFSGNNDGTNVGTWVPTEATDWESTEGPLDTATYTEEASPNSGDRVEVLTDGGAAETLSDIIEYVPAIVHGITLSGMGQGAGNARVRIGDGTSESAGAATALTGSPTKMKPSITANQPSGGAYTGSSTPAYVFEFD